MKSFKSEEEARAAGVYISKVKSFVKREGRLTNAQARAIEVNWPSKGLSVEQGLLNFYDVFGRTAPTVLEIGFGMGKSLVEMAAAAIENLRVFEHDAVEVLAQSIADNSLHRLQLYFPDPWHKTRHHKRRIVQPDFVQNLRNKLAVGGTFHMATDWEQYAEHMMDVMTQAQGFENTSSEGPAGYVPRPDYRPITKFEVRGQKLGHGVWDLIFKRVS
jgi:tRNA (guanine-N7-)-methyltransferase